MYTDLQKKTNVWVEANIKVYFPKISKMTYLNHVNSVDFLASDS
jgi:hypothetical protein